ncbi:MAG: hypothetical protein ACI88C_002838, partial [Acidimicrobiales bacterium]
MYPVGIIHWLDPVDLLGWLDPVDLLGRFDTFVLVGWFDPVDSQSAQNLVRRRQAAWAVATRAAHRCGAGNSCCGVGQCGTRSYSNGDPMSLDPSVSRPMWEAVERFHGLTYIAPEVREEGIATGLKGFWMNYFASRIAPIGPVGALVVESTFFYYAPARVRRAIPDAWSFSTPVDVVAARYRGMDRALRATYSDV